MYRGHRARVEKVESVIMQEFGHQLVERIKMHAKKNCFEMIYNTVEFAPAALALRKTGDRSAV